MTTTFARKSVSEEKIVISQLSERVNEYEANLPLNETEHRLWVDTKNKLEDKLFGRVKGIMFRSKAKWYEEGERSTKYFFSLEKSKYHAKTCFKVIDDQGCEIEQPKAILEVQRKFYEELYEEDQEVDFNMVNNTGVKVPQHLEEKQTQQISIMELEEAIKCMNNNKTPGSDGIPVDFDKVFWNKIKKTLL